MEVSVFRNYRDKQPVTSTLETIVQAIRTDARLAQLTTQYRTFGSDSVKEQSPLFGVAALFEDGKSEQDITGVTGLSMVDIDHVEPELLPAIRQQVEADTHTLLAYTTISGRGLRVIFAYMLTASFTLKEHRAFYPKVFAAGNDYYARLLGITTDAKCKNIGRLSGLAYDPAAYFNPDAEPFMPAWIESRWNDIHQRHKDETRARRELKRLQRTYDTVIRPEVEAEGAVYGPGTHNDYVMRVGYKLNQFGFVKETAVAWAAQTFADYDKAADVVLSCYEHTEEFGTRRQYHHSTHPPDTPWASVGAIRQFLDTHIRLRHNVITGRVEGLTPDPSPAGEGGFEQWQPISDRVVNSLWSEMSKTQRVNIQDIYRVIGSDYVPAFNPFWEYLSQLKMENGKWKIKELAATVTVRGGEAEQAVWEEYLRKWLVGMVAGWLDTSVVNNVILVLIGEQGAYKTTWFNYLLPPPLRPYFYTKTNANRMSRDDLLTLSQYGLICCEELDTMRPAELNQLKAAVTMPSIDERAAYAHYAEHRPHIASFCGTGNNAQFLSDPTGNRRWLPFEVEHIRSPRDHPLDYDAIYAEAYELYRSGFRYWFDKAEIQLLAEHNCQFETPRLEAELVQAYFRHPSPTESGEFMSVARAMQIVGAGMTQKLSAVNLGRAFLEQGFERKRYNKIRGYVVVCRSGDEIKGFLKTMALQAQTEKGDR